MFSLKLFVCLSTLYVTANAAGAVMNADEKPAKFAHLEGCYMKKYDRVLPYGESYNPTGDVCASFRCFGEGSIEMSACGSVGISAGCEPAAGDKSQPYPKCCDGVKCRKSDGTYEYMFYAIK